MEILFIRSFWLTLSYSYYYLLEYNDKYYKLKEAELEDNFYIYEL